MSSAPSALNPNASLELPHVRHIGPGDLKDALREGLDDFLAVPTHSLFLIAIYPTVGLLLFRLTFGYDMLPLIFPLAAGFALIGPLAMAGVYELSRRRQEGREASWDALNVFRLPRVRGLAVFGLLLMAIFFAWLLAATAIYRANFGHWSPASLAEFASQLFGTPAGWSLITTGCGVGFVFAAATFCISVVSIPMLLDRDVSVGVAIATSLKAVATNLPTMSLWAIIIAVALAIGSLPFFLGLAVALPVLGHASWRLYAKVVER